PAPREVPRAGRASSLRDRGRRRRESPANRRGGPAATTLPPACRAAAFARAPRALGPLDVEGRYEHTQVLCCVRSRRGAEALRLTASIGWDGKERARRGHAGQPPARSIGRLSRGLERRRPRRRTPRRFRRGYSRQRLWSCWADLASGAQPYRDGCSVEGRYVGGHLIPRVTTRAPIGAQRYRTNALGPKNGR